MNDIESLKKEASDLIFLNKMLDEFLNTEEFSKLPRNKKTLIYKQFRIMCEYIEVLGERIEIEIKEKQLKESYKRFFENYMNIEEDKNDVK